MSFSIKLGSLTVSIGADTEGFEKGADKVSKKLVDVGKNVREGVNTWGKWAAAAVAASAAVATAVIKSNLSTIRELKNSASAANESVASFQRGAFAAQQYGIEQEKFGDILKDVNDRVGDFLTTGGGPMLDFFEQIGPKVGVTIDSFKNLSGQQALGLYVESLQKANLSQADMTFYMEALAGDSTRLIPLFQDNSKAMKELTKEAKDLGVGMSEIDVANAIAAQRELDKISLVLGGEIKKAVADLAPFITAISKEFLNVTQSAGGFSQLAIPAFEKVGYSVALIGNAVQVIKIAIKGLQVVALGVTSIITVAFLELNKAITGVGNMILEGWRLIFVEMGNLVGGISDSAKEIFNDIAKGINSVKGKVPDIITEIADSQVSALSRTKDELHNLMMEEVPTESFENFVTKVKEAAIAAAPEIKAALTGESVSKETKQGEGMSGGEKKEADRLREENKAILEALLEEGMMREETLLGRIERERMIVNEARTNELISKEEHQRAMNEIDQKEADIKMSIISSSIEAAISALSLGGKKASKVQKALAITNAVIKGKEAAVAAWSAGMSTGGPWAPLVAAAYTTASIARTAGMIKSISSSGKSAGGGGASIPSISSNGGSGSSGGGSGGQNAQPNRTVDIKFSGSGLMSMEQVREVMGQMNEALGDGATLNVVGG